MKPKLELSKYLMSGTKYLGLSEKSECTSGWEDEDRVFEVFFFLLWKNGQGFNRNGGRVFQARKQHDKDLIAAMPGKSHGWRSLVGYSPWGLEESDTTERLHFHYSFSCIGEGNGNPLQCSCLENPRDGGAW